MSQQGSTKTDLDLARFTDKMVNLSVWTDDDDLASKGTVIEVKDGLTLIDVSGKITGTNPKGQVFLFKPRSQRTTHMLQAGHVEKLELAGSATLRPIGQKSLRPLSVQNARRHLVDFHGWARSAVNEMSEELALQKHEEIDHSDLGHNHDLAENGLNSKAAPTTQATREQILARINAA